MARITMKPMEARLTGDAARGPTCDLAVVVNEFPKLSETFVLHDLLALESAGARLEVFALRRPAPGVSHEALGRLKAPVHYLPEVQGRQRQLALRATRLLLFLRDPFTYLRGMAQVYASPDYSRLRLNQGLLLASELESIGAPALYIHFAHKPATIGRFASLLLGLPYAISAHAVDVWTPPAKELRTKVQGAQVVLTCYDEARAYLQRLAKTQTQVQLVYHGVEVPPDGASEAQSSPPVVLAVGRLVEKKGYPILLEAAATLRERGLDFELRIAGEGPEWPTLQRLVNQLGLESTVRFLGPLSDAEIEREYGRAAVFALPLQTLADGNRDGLPNTLLEAMARAIPVVSTRLASVAEAVDDGEQGLLVPERDPQAVADALARLLRDPELRRRMGAAGRARVIERFDRELCAPRVFEALAGSGLLDGRRP